MAGFVPPPVLVTRQVLEVMTAEVLAHPAIETAWGLYGVILPDGSVIVAGVLRPTDTDIVRRVVTTEYGGQSAAARVAWLAANHKLMCDHGLNPNGARFSFLYKGHSHHTLAFDRYSMTDITSIREAVVDDGLEVAIGPLATIAVNGTVIKPIEDRKHGLRVIGGSEVKFRFYYFSKTMAAARRRLPVLVQPTVIDAADVPLLPPMGWQFTQEDEYLEQLRHLRAMGCDVTILHRDIQAGPPYELQFIVKHPAWRKMLSIVTAYDYPKTPPQFAYVATGKEVPGSPFVGYPALLEGPLWQPGDDFLEVVLRLLARGEL